MSISAHHAHSHRSICWVLAGMTVLASIHGAAADDGVTRFFSSIFGGGSSQPAASPAPASVAPAETYVPYSRQSIRASRHDHSHTLTLHLHRTAPKLVVAQMPTKPGEVSIYEDRTLKRGDAVMTADGIRIFAGSVSWPYTKADFIDLASAKNLNKDTTKVLAEVDRLPRS